MRADPTKAMQAEKRPCGPLFCLYETPLYYGNPPVDMLYGAVSWYGNPLPALARCHPLSKRGRLGAVNSSAFRFRTALESAHPKRLLWQRGGAECAQWAMQRGGSPVSKGALGSRPCGDTARPLRTVGPVMAQAVTEDCLTCAAAANCRGCRRRRLRVVVFPQPAKIKFAPRSPSPFLKYQLRILLQSTTISPYPPN